MLLLFYSAIVYSQMPANGTPSINNGSWTRGGNARNPAVGNSPNIFGTMTNPSTGAAFNSPIYFATDNVIRMTLMGTTGPNPGFLGINTLAPSGRLEVIGESHFGFTSYTDPHPGFPYDAKFGGTVRGIAVNGISIFNNSVGIGTKNPQSILHLNDGIFATNLQITNAVTGATATDGFLLGITATGNAQFIQQETSFTC